MDFELEASATDVIAMNLTMTALEQWLKNVSSDRRGEELGREIGELYREIHSAVAEMSPDDDDEDDEDYEDDDDDEEEEEEEGHGDERD